MNQIVKAARFALIAHADQRYGPRPYYCHLQEVVSTVRVVGFANPEVEPLETVLAAAWLHDVLEDTDYKVHSLQDAGFDPDVIALVQAVTDPPGKNRKERKALAYPRIRQGGVQAVALKLADRLANVQACQREGREDLLEMYHGEMPAMLAVLYKHTPS